MIDNIKTLEEIRNLVWRNSEQISQCLFGLRNYKHTLERAIPNDWCYRYRTQDKTFTKQELLADIEALISKIAALNRTNMRITDYNDYSE